MRVGCPWCGCGELIDYGRTDYQVRVRVHRQDEDTFEYDDVGHPTLGDAWFDRTGVYCPECKWDGDEQDLVPLAEVA